MKNYPGHWMNFERNLSTEQKREIENLDRIYDYSLCILNLFLDSKLISEGDYFKLSESVFKGYQKQKAAIFLEPKINDLGLKANSIITKGLEKAIRAI